MIHCFESFTKVTLLEGEGVIIFIVLLVVGKGDDSGLILLVACVVGMFEICFNAIANANRINKVLVIFGDLFFT